MDNVRLVNVCLVSHWIHKAIVRSNLTVILKYTLFKCKKNNPHPQGYDHQTSASAIFPLILINIRIRIRTSTFINIRYTFSVYLPSCSIQGLSYTHLVLSPYLYLSRFFFSGKFFLFPSLWGYFSGESYTFFASFKQIPSKNDGGRIFVPSTTEHLICSCFVSVSFRLFINMKIVIKSPLSLLSFSVVICISINLSSYVSLQNLAPS